MPVYRLPRSHDEIGLLLVQLCQRQQVLLFALRREGVYAFAFPLASQAIPTCIGIVLPLLQ